MEVNDKIMIELLTEIEEKSKLFDEKQSSIEIDLSDPVRKFNYEHLRDSWKSGNKKHVFTYPRNPMVLSNAQEEREKRKQLEAWGRGEPITIPKPPSPLPNGLTSYGREYLFELKTNRQQYDLQLEQQEIGIKQIKLNHCSIRISLLALGVAILSLIVAILSFVIPYYFPVSNPTPTKQLSPNDSETVKDINPRLPPVFCIVSHVNS